MRFCGLVGEQDQKDGARTIRVCHHLGGHEALRYNENHSSYNDDLNSISVWKDPECLNIAQSSCCMFLPMQVAGAASKGCWGWSCTPLLVRVTWWGCHGCCMVDSALRCIKGCWPLPNLARVQVLMRSPAETVLSWRQWKRCKELLEDAFGFVYIQVKTKKPLRWYLAHSLQIGKLPAFFEGIEGCLCLIFAVK